MARSRNHCSHTSEVRDGTSWAQDNPCSAGIQRARYSYNDSAHRSLHNELIDKFIRTMSDLSCHYKEMIIYNPRVLYREFRALKDCLNEQVSALARSAPLCIKRHTYSVPAGQTSQQWQCHNRNICEQRTVQLALSPTIQVGSIPVSQQLMCSETCNKSLYSPQTALQ